MHWFVIFDDRIQAKTLISEIEKVGGSLKSKKPITHENRTYTFLVEGPEHLPGELKQLCTIIDVIANSEINLQPGDEID